MKKRSYFPVPIRWSILFACFWVLNISVLEGQVTSTSGTDSAKMQVRTFSDGGRLIDEVIISGRPPLYEDTAAAAAESTETGSTTATILSNVPAFNWTYGCSATSAGMMMGYYDNMGYSYLYTGPTNGGVCPMNNETYWGTTAWTSITCGECPLVATHLGIDGRTTRGHVEDYWIDYLNTDSDPFIVNNWTEHTSADCVADFMGTNQSTFSNTDGTTRFFFSSGGGICDDYTGGEPTYRDGCHGLRLFAESRGYTVSDNYSQYISGYNGNTKGFTFADFENEINNGRPVLIHVTNHTMLGYGYDDSTSTIYIHDTWNHTEHTMTWGGTYSGMTHYGVTVIHLSGTSPTVTDIAPGSGLNSGVINITSLAGTNFRDDATVKLVMAGQPDIVATNVGMSSTTSLSCSFDLSNVACGSWSVVVTNTGGETGTLDSGFTVEPYLYFVSPNGNDSNSGTSWSSAKKTVTAALAATKSGCEVWVAAGTYSEQITLKAGVALYGGFAGTETERAQRDFKTNLTILDGQTAGPVVTPPSGAGVTTRIDGFTIQNGIGKRSLGSYYGGGIYCFSSSPTLSNNTIIKNTATSGAGIYCDSSSPTITNNIIQGNTATNGGGIYFNRPSTPTVINNTICGNRASSNGGGIYCSSSSPTLANNIIAFNGTGIYASSGSPVLHNNCLYNTTSNYSGLSAGSTDIQKDPLLVDVDGGDYHLTETSPCIDAGDDSCIQTSWLDMDGNSRVNGNHVDIGADEWYSNAIPGDANGDGRVDIGDLGILAANYGVSSGATWTMGDFNADGVIDIGDLGILAANYGYGVSGTANYEADYVKVFNSSATEENISTNQAESEETADATADGDESTLCSNLGLSLIAGFAISGLMLVRIKE